MPDTCPFYDEMDALMCPRAATSVLEVAGGVLGQRDHDTEHEELQSGCWDQEAAALAKAVLGGGSI